MKNKLITEITKIKKMMGLNESPVFELYETDPVEPINASDPKLTLDSSLHITPWYSSLYIHGEKDGVPGDMISFHFKIQNKTINFFECIDDFSENEDEQNQVIPKCVEIIKENIANNVIKLPFVSYDFVNGTFLDDDDPYELTTFSIKFSGNLAKYN